MQSSTFLFLALIFQEKANSYKQSQHVPTVFSYPEQSVSELTVVDSFIEPHTPP
jgi:hypothetical protein